MLEEVGISVEFSHHETGPGQNEIDPPRRRLQTADNVTTFPYRHQGSRLLTQACTPTFMPKPLRSAGRHAYPLLPLRRRHQRIFRAGAEYQLSKTAAASSPVLNALNSPAVTNQFINSPQAPLGRRRGSLPTSPGAITTVCPSCVSPDKPNKMQSARIEYRGLDSASTVPRLRGDSCRRFERYRETSTHHARRDRGPPP